MHEVLQLIPMGKKSGLKDARIAKLWNLTNLLEIVSAALNIVLVVNELADRRLLTSDNSLRLCAWTAIALVYFKFFYWMRLFERHAFFIALLTKTLQGIVSFIWMLIILICMITNMFYVMINVDHEYYKMEGNSMPAIFEEFFSEYDFEDNYNLINSFVTTYNLALGEFDFGAYNTRGKFS